MTKAIYLKQSLDREIEIKDDVYVHYTDVEAIIENIFTEYENEICKSCTHKRDAGINGNKMNDEYFCVVFARCYDKDFGCNKWESERGKLKQK